MSVNRKIVPYFIYKKHIKLINLENVGKADCNVYSIILFLETKYTKIYTLPVFIRITKLIFFNISKLLTLMI